MAIEGAIADRARAILPVTWDALVNDQRFGEGPLVAALDTAKESVLGVIPATAVEDGYAKIVIDYVAKIAVLEIIPGAIDYWMSEPMMATTQQPVETTTYDNRADRLMKLRDQLLQETREEAADIAAIVGYQRTRGRSVPQLNTAGDVLLTPDPQEFPRPYIQTNRS